MIFSRRKLGALSRTLGRLAASVSVAGLVAACQETTAERSTGRAYRRIPAATVALMNNKGADSHSPVLIRTFKKEAELEIWKMKPDGKYAYIKTFPMCRWSGQLGPKTREGDRQVPEGFYNITPSQMNPNSNYYLSFNVGYPNAYDKAHGYTGGLIMVHGACSSAGCFSMTDDQIAEIYAIAREAFAGGQKTIQMQSLPFHMTAENLAKHRLDPNMKFWKDLKVGADSFDVTKQEPQVAFCGRRYVFNAAPQAGARMDASEACPPLQENESIKAAVAEKEREDQAKVAELIAKGVQPVKVVYADGGQNPEFANVSWVSRPEALAQGPVEIPLNEKGQPVPAIVQVAAAREAASQPAPVAVAQTVVSKTNASAAATATAATPVPAKAPAATVVAAYAPTPPAPAKTEDAPFYSGIVGKLGSISDLLGGQPEPAAPVAPATSQPTAAPTPPARPAAAAIPAKAQVATAPKKPPAAAPKPKPVATLTPAPLKKTAAAYLPPLVQSAGGTYARVPSPAETR